MHFKPHVLEDPCFCFGKALYEGKLTADYMGTDLTDMGRGRFDLAGGLLRCGPLESVVTDTPALTALVGALLADGWIHRGLPRLRPGSLRVSRSGTSCLAASKL